MTRFRRFNIVIKKRENTEEITQLSIFGKMSEKRYCVSHSSVFKIVHKLNIPGNFYAVEMF